ncbi:MAG: efflux RND transporter periplasmic adaptor subunit [Candidatus Paceibacterota bacterium]
MRLFMRPQLWIYGSAFLLFVVVIVALAQIFRGHDVSYVTHMVDEGRVREVVSVSGVIDAEHSAELSFPVTGIVSEVLVSEGDLVGVGDTLVQLDAASQSASYQDAEAALAIASANRDELIAGPRDESRAVTALSVTQAYEDLARVTAEQDEKVKNALRSLLSDDLEAFPANKSVTSDAPTIAGTYTCEETGEYVLDMYASGAQSGYSYELSGLGNGIYSAYNSAPADLGDCGLTIQFTEDGRFASTDWLIPVPNPQGANYASNLNAYELALQTQANAIAEAEEAVDTAITNEALANATPRNEALLRANAAVTQAAARLATVAADLSDRSLKAPFAGTVTKVDVQVGETVRTNPVVTILGTEPFDLTARIPEIDIAKINIGQSADVVFDAAAEETVEALVVFISPIATEIDGVAYFEATLRFLNPPQWLRSGLNADIDIVVAEEADTVRIPERYLTEIDDRYYVLRETNEKWQEHEVEVGFRGNDGFVSIVSGLRTGDVIAVPES